MPTVSPATRQARPATGQTAVSRNRSARSPGVTLRRAGCEPLRIRDANTRKRTFLSAELRNIAAEPNLRKRVAAGHSGRHMGGYSRSMSEREIQRILGLSAEMRKQALAAQRAVAASQISKVHFNNTFSEQARQTLAEAVPKFDFAAMVPKFDFASAVPKLDFASAFLKFDFLERFDPLMRALSGFADLWEECRSPNWPEDSDEIERIIDLMRETGYCVVWAPRSEIVIELLEADHADRSSLLLARREEILDDLEAVLGDVDGPSFQLARGSAEEAIAAFRDGHHRSAQALAAVILTDIIHARMGKKTSKALKEFEEQEPEESNIRELRLRAIYVPARRALATWHPLGKAPAPDDFNRHASSHGLTSQQYTHHNALAGLMLVIPFLREMDVLTKLIEARKSRELAPQPSP
jgi:hypothetical protein